MSIAQPIGAARTRERSPHRPPTLAAGATAPIAARDMSEADFRLIAESIPHIVFMTGPDGSTEYLNSRGTEYTGLPAEANYGWGWLSLVHPDDVEQAGSAWAHAIITETPFESEYRIRGADCEYRWHGCRALPVRNGLGSIVKWIGTCTDIEEQKQLEQDLRQSERESTESLTLLETLQSTAPVGFGFVDRDFRFVRVNEMLAAINGASVEDHLGRRVADLVPTLWPEIEQAYRRVIDTGEALVNWEIVGETAANPGEIRNWLVNLHPVRIDDDVVGIGIVVIDVTEHKQAETFQSAVMDNMAEGVYALDPDGHLMFMNAAASKMLGWREDELRGKSMHAAVHFQRADGTAFPEGECELLKVRTNGQTVRAIDDAFTRKDGSIFPVGSSAAPLFYWTDTQGVVVVFRDTTEERAEEARAQRELAMLTWVGRIRDALDEGRLMLYSQPIVSLSDFAPSEELLVRMVGRNGEVIPPGTFLPAAEKYGLITEIDRWVVRQAARIAASGRRVQANLSAESIANLDLLGYIEHELREAGADPSNLCFELTETALIRDAEASQTFAQGLANLGCHLALDDFGTGFGSFTYLKKLRAEYLKIDVDFVRDLVSNQANQHLVKAIVGLAKGFGYKTIAEGVEDAETLALLREYGVDYAQGFHLGRPAPIETT